jgi:uncharacterized small protein (DUF1192 family)
MNTLIACVGTRDPIYVNELDKRSFQTSEEKEAALKAICRIAEQPDDEIARLIEKAKNKSPNLIYMAGPIAGALHHLKATSGLPESLCLLYTATADVKPRAKACKHFLKDRYLVPSLIELESSGFADYDKAYVQVKNRMRERFPNSNGDGFAFLIGPATPQLNFALMLYHLEFMPLAELWHVKNPKDVELANLNKPYPSAKDEEFFVPIKFDGTALPRLVAGEVDERIARLDREIERLRTIVAAVPKKKRRKRTTGDKIREHIKSLEERGIRQKQVDIAKQFGVVQGYVSRIQKQMGFKKQRRR